jgi:hypothetical protein
MIARFLPLVGLSLLLASPAAAQGGAAAVAPPSAPATAKAAAQESYLRGNQLFNQAEQKHDRTLYEAAYLQFSQAFAVFPDDRILWNLIVSETKTERYVDALRHLRAYDKRQHVANEPRHAQHAVFAALFEQASKATGHLVIEAPVAAPLRLDGTDIGSAPLADPVDVQPGAHKLEAALGGGKVLSASASPAAGEVVHVALTEDPPLASTSLQAPVPVGPSTPSPDRDVPPGAGFFTTRNTIALGLGVVAVGALALGTGFEVASGNDQGTAKQLGAQLPNGGNVCTPGSTVPQCAQLRDANSSAASHQNAATAFFITGGVAGVAAVGVLLLWPSHSDARAGMLSPMILPSTGGLQWLGTF